MVILNKLIAKFVKVKNVYLSKLMSSTLPDNIQSQITDIPKVAPTNSTKNSSSLLATNFPIYLNSAGVPTQCEDLYISSDAPKEYSISSTSHPFLDPHLDYYMGAITLNSSTRSDYKYWYLWNFKNGVKNLDGNTTYKSAGLLRNVKSGDMFVIGRSWRQGPSGSPSYNSTTKRYSRSYTQLTSGYDKGIILNQALMKRPDNKPGQCYVRWLMDGECYVKEPSFYSGGSWKTGATNVVNLWCETKTPDSLYEWERPNDQNHYIVPTLMKTIFLDKQVWEKLAQDAYKIDSNLNVYIKYLCLPSELIRNGFMLKFVTRWMGHVHLGAIASDDTKQPCVVHSIVKDSTDSSGWQTSIPYTSLFQNSCATFIYYGGYFYRID